MQFRRCWPAGSQSRLGPRRALTVGVLWWGVFTLATATVPPFDARRSLDAYCCSGLHLALAKRSSIRLLTSSSPDGFRLNERGRVNGVIFAGVGAGSMLTPPILTAIILAFRMALRVLVQRGDRRGCRDRLVRDCARHAFNSISWVSCERTGDHSRRHSGEITLPSHRFRGEQLFTAAR